MAGIGAVVVVVVVVVVGNGVAVVDGSESSSVVGFQFKSRIRE